MDCEKFGKYLDNFESLTEEERLEMTAHASECERCANELDFMLSVIKTVKSLPDIEPPADFLERLNARIDEEERKKKISSRIAYSISRNWKQYTAAAACLALVAVLTANGKLLTDRLAGTDDGVIVSDIPVTNGAEPEVSPMASAEPTVSDNTAVPEITQETIPESRAVQNTVTTDKKEAVKPKTVSTPSAKQVAETIKPDVTVAAVNIDNSGSQGIAAANIQDNSEDMIAVYSEEPDAVQSKSRSAIAGYTLSGKTVMETAEHGVGRIKISPKDEKKAMETIMKYSYEVDGDYYTASPDNMVNIFCDLDDSGVSYANYTPEDYQDLIKFQLVIG